MKFRRKRYCRTGKIIVGAMVAGMLSISGCGNGEQADLTEQAETQEETVQNTESSVGTTEEETLETAMEAEEEHVSEEDNTEDLEETGSKKENVPIQGQYPAQISIIGYDESETDYFFDADGDLVRAETKTKDGNITKEETEYVLDEHGNKVYGITEDSLLDTTIPLKYEALNHKIAEKPLIHTIQSSADEVTFTYDADQRVIKKTESYGETAYTYEEQDGNLTVTSADSSDKFTFQYNKDGYLILSNSEGVDPGDSFFSTNTYEYNDHQQLTAILEKSSREDLEDTNTKITYDAAGNIQRIDDGTYAREYEGYDDNGNWMSCTYYDNGKIDCFLVCEYDDNGNRLNRSFGIGDALRTALYHYDEEGRLMDISIDDKVLYQFTYNSNGLLERIEKVNEYEYSETEKEAIHWYVLDQEIWQEIEAYVGEYTGIASSSDLVSSNISYRNGAAFHY